ncbi:hypothetical protein DCO47_13705 [Pseudomonas sp. NDM]|nr:hypothetical protein DCO47_13705 [Pseudomonas sp. NDM]
MLPLDCEAVLAFFQRRAAARPSGSKLPRHSCSIRSGGLRDHGLSWRDDVGLHSSRTSRA